MKKYILIFASISIFSIYNLQAQVNGAILQGNSVTASGQYSSAIGNQTQATGLGSFAGGRESVATKNYTMAFGNFCQATGHYAISLGSASIANADNAISIGVNTTASGANAMSFGQFVKATGTNSIALGRGYLTTELTNGISNSFMVSFNSTNATLFVGPNNSGVSTGTGNVGIATTAPGSKLQVNGNAAVGYSGSTAAPANGLLINGNVGIGTTAPTEKLTVNGGIKIGNSSTNDDGVIRWSGTDFEGRINGTWKSLTTAATPSLWNGSTTHIYTSGKVSIGGTNIPTDGKLAVNGKIYAREVEVNTDTWPDYVFNKEYTLPSLFEVEQFINTHKHLPGMPSEKEVIGNGINLGKMDALLLQKIEELTLYVIELKKENVELKNLVQLLNK